MLEPGIERLPHVLGIELAYDIGGPQGTLRKLVAVQPRLTQVREVSSKPDSSRKVVSSFFRVTTVIPLIPRQGAN